MTILIVEHEKKQLEMLRQTLESGLYSVDTARDGKVCLAKASKNNYDVILLSVTLPKENGVAVCKKLREENIMTPIIMMASQNSLDDKVNCFGLGADDYLVKSPDTSELLARIRAIMRRGKNISLVSNKK